MGLSLGGFGYSYNYESCCIGLVYVNVFLLEQSQYEYITIPNKINTINNIIRPKCKGYI